MQSKSPSEHDRGGLDRCQLARGRARGAPRGTMSLRDPHSVMRRGTWSRMGKSRSCGNEGERRYVGGETCRTKDEIDEGLS